MPVFRDSVEDLVVPIHKACGVLSHNGEKERESMNSIFMCYPGQGGRRQWGELRVDGVISRSVWS